ncbi:MAG TPA: hypothetical protein VKY65_17460 [Alphaproteobacteria bacterium]|nr:hypothetical protein [Alphaproteobacteria bacterium]
MCFKRVSRACRGCPARRAIQLVLTAALLMLGACGVNGSAGGGGSEGGQHGHLKLNLPF